MPTVVLVEVCAWLVFAVLRFVAATANAAHQAGNDVICVAVAHRQELVQAAEQCAAAVAAHLVRPSAAF